MSDGSLHARTAYSLRLLGIPGLEGLSGPVPGRTIPGRRLAILALLGAGGTAGLSRDKLIGLLWPDRPGPDARHSLSDVVYRLRRDLGEVVLTSDGEMLRLDRAVVSVDVDEFDVAIARGDFPAATDLYRGPFLDGFHLAGSCREFEGWVDHQRARFGLEYERILESLAERSEADGHDILAIESWRQLSRNDPANSRVVLRLMRALARAGDSANAVQLAREHELYLRAELDLEPPTEVRELADRLRTASGSWSPVAGKEAGPANGPVPFPGLTPPRQPDRLPLGFVARGEEIALLTGDLQGAVGGIGRVRFVSGEAGAGKTALVEEFCRRSMEARADLIVVSTGGNAHTGAGDPYHMFREILALLTGDVEAPLAAGAMSLEHATRLWNLLPAAVAALLDHGPAMFGPFIPLRALLERAEAYGAENRPWRSELSRLAESRSHGPPGAPTQSSLFSQLGRVLFAMARERPLVLVLDDLQWADRGSLELLCQLGLQLHGSRILILGLYRPSDVALGRNGDRHPLESVINDLVRHYGDIEVALGQDEDRGFVEALVDAEPNDLGPEFRDRLFGLTRGNALFSVELLRSLRDDGALQRDESGVWTEGPALDWNRLPARIEAVIAERVSRVPGPLQRVLSIASVEGERFTLEAVADVLDLSARELLSGVSSELERRHHLVQAEGIRRLDGRRASVYRFRHNLFQQFLYDRLDDVERSHFHERIGVGLEALYGEEGDQIVLPLARHFERAGLPEKAAAYRYQAGERAMAAGASREAQVHFGAALELLSALPSTTEREQFELDLQLALGYARHFAGALGPADEALERALELAERVGDGRQTFWAVTGLYYIRGHFAGDNREGFSLAERSLSLARSVDDNGLLVAALENVGRNAMMRGEVRTSLACYDELASLYDPAEHRMPAVHGGIDLGLLALGMIALAWWRLGYPDRGRERMIEAMTLARAVEDQIVLPVLLYYDLLIHMSPADVPYSLERSEELRRVSEELEQYWGPFARIHLGWCRAHQGEAEAGAELIRRGLDEWIAFGWRIGVVYATALLAQALRVNGRADEGLRLLDEARETSETVDDHWQLPEIHKIRGELMAALDDPVGAEASFRESIEIARIHEARSDELRATTSLARLLQVQGRDDEARALLNQIYGWFTEGFDTADLVEARELLEDLDAEPAALPATQGFETPSGHQGS